MIREFMYLAMLMLRIDEMHRVMTSQGLPRAENNHDVVCEIYNKVTIHVQQCSCNRRRAHRLHSVLAACKLALLVGLIVKDLIKTGVRYCSSIMSKVSRRLQIVDLEEATKTGGWSW